MGYDHQFISGVHKIMTDNRCITSQEQKIEIDFWRNAMRLNTSIPGIINSFDKTTNTVSATPAIKAKYIDPETGSVSYISYPMITNIPLAIARGSGVRLTYPVTPGNPCTLIFSQRSIDNFILEGAIANPVEGNNPMTSIIRCMDLTDAMCFPGVITTKDPVADYATDAIELRSDDGKVKVSVKQDSLTLKQDSATISLSGGNIDMTAGTINITGTTAVNITAPANVIKGTTTGTSIDTYDFKTHKHSVGTGTTGGVV